MTKDDLSEKVKECDEAEERIVILDRVIQILYEDKVDETLSGKLFIKLSKNYESERVELIYKVKFLKEELMAVQKETVDINKSMRLIKRYTEIAKLNAEIIRIFIGNEISAHKGEGRMENIGRYQKLFVIVLEQYLKCGKVKLGT